MGTDTKSQTGAGGFSGATMAGPPSHGPAVQLKSNDVSRGIRIAGIILRTIFMAALLVVVVRVSAPQSESIWSAYETPGDLIRMVLGFAVCVWILIHLFVLPKDAGAYRTWIYLGIPLAPLTIACLFAVW